MYPHTNELVFLSDSLGFEGFHHNAAIDPEYSKNFSRP